MKVAFILNARDKAKHVERAAVSILKQTYSPMQIIFSDQGSTDNTRAILHKVAAGYSGPNTVYLLDCPKTEHTGMPGMNAHFNWLMDEVDADVFIQLSADDYSFPERAAKTVAAYEQFDPSMVLTGMYFSNEAGEYQGENAAPNKSGMVPYQDIFKDSVGGSCAQSWTRDFYRKINGLNGVGSQDVIMPFLAALDKGCYYVHDRLHTFVKYKDPKNTGLQGVYDAAETTAEKLQIEELCHFQITAGLYTVLMKMEEAGLRNDDAVYVLAQAMLDRNASWVNVRQKMTFERIPPIPFKV